jgi:hypothetical protein
MGNSAMKTIILAAFAALTLSVGFANAQGVPTGFQGPAAYGSHAFADLHNATSGQTGGGATSAKGG